MRFLLWIGVGVATVCLATSGGSKRAGRAGAMPSLDSSAPVVSSDGSIAVVGRTQPVHDRRWVVPPQSLRTESKTAPQGGSASATSPAKSAVDDLRELDVLCHLTAQQAEDLALGQEVDLWVTETEQPLPRGRLIYIGSIADPQTGLVPLTVRVKNLDQQLRPGILVSLQFAVGSTLADK